MFKLEYDLEDHCISTYYHQIGDFITKNLGIKDLVFYSNQSSTRDKWIEVTEDTIKKEENSKIIIVEYDKSINELSTKNLNLYRSKALSLLCGSEYFIVGKINRDLVDKLLKKVEPLQEISVVMKGEFDIKVITALCNSYSLEVELGVVLINNSPLILEGYRAVKVYQTRGLTDVINLDYDRFYEFQEHGCLITESYLEIGDKFMIVGDADAFYTYVKDCVNLVNSSFKYQFEDAS